jgi:2-oxoglutarate/2-oxoacid ferredoxin oxidoreductase subunit beta
VETVLLPLRLVRAIERTGYDQRDVVIVSGIGCSSRAAGYLNFNTLHTTHGRALAFATGLKMARPELETFCDYG